MGKSTGHHGKGTGKSRRESVLRSVERQSFSARKIIMKPEFLRTFFVIFFFLITVSFLTTWSQEQIKVRVGQIASSTRITRVDYDHENVTETNRQKEEARNSSPKIYTVNVKFIDRLEYSLKNLPDTISQLNSVEEISDEITKLYSFTHESFSALKDNAVVSRWTRGIERIIRGLKEKTPLLTSKEFQVFENTLPTNRELFRGAGKNIIPYSANPSPLPAVVGEYKENSLSAILSLAGFPDSITPLIESRLISENLPSIQLDVEDTTTRAQTAVEKVLPVIVSHKVGDIIWKRGDSISQDQYDEAVEEQKEFIAVGEWQKHWYPRVGAMGLLAMLSIFIGAYTTITYPKIAKNSLRLISLCALMAAMLSISIIITIKAPTFIFAAAIIPTLLAVTISCLVYKQRMGMFIAFMQCSLVTMALSQTIGWFIFLIAGSGVMIGQLKEVRQRQTLIRASVTTSIAFAIGALFLGLASIPYSSIAWDILLTNSVVAGISAVIVGFFVLGVLQNIEQIFDITTGMTLADYRDPRNPLLRQLQHLAPGTFNHSRQVADIAETATEAIGGDSLLAYVGGLYHDIGKMNKPEYFVENQTGYNRHESLKPSMSLLIIIGHVKDGIELARGFDLPKELIHFIESHHGTTLVEYFYRTAMSESKETGNSINEMQFRYPGPKPQTKEAAVLMIADAVESASRVLPDPNPARIESLVRDLSRKRLLDHQYDDCNLTFCELAKIEDAIISRLNSIYHTRIKYPDEDTTIEVDVNDPEVIEAEIEGDLAG